MTPLRTLALILGCLSAGYVVGKHGCERQRQLAVITALEQANEAVRSVTAVASDAASVAQWLNLYLGGEVVERSKFRLWRPIAFVGGDTR